MNREVQRLQRLLAACGVGVADQDVGAEAHHALDRVGPAFEDRAVEVVAGDPALLLGPEGPAGGAHRLRHLRGRDQLPAPDVGGRDGVEQDIAARRVEAAGQRIEQRDRARGLAGIGVLADAGPAVAGDRAGLGDQARGFAQRLGRHPGDRLDPLGRECAAVLGIEVEGRAARNCRAVRACDLEASAERRRAAVVARGRRVVEHRRAGGLVPRHPQRRVCVRAEVVGAERGAVGLAHQQRAVGPVAHEGRIEVPVLDEQVSKAERKRPVAAGPHPQPGIRLDREAGAARVDDDQLRTARLRLGDPAGIGEPGGARIAPPQDDAVGSLEVRHRRVDAEGERVDVVPVEVADLRAVGRVGAAVGVAQALDPGIGVLNGGARRRGDGEGHTLRPVRGGEPLQVAGGLVERLVPAYPPPLGRRVLGRDAAERMEQPVGVIDQLGRRPALAAERLAGGVRGVRLDRHQAAVVDHRDAAA